MTESRSQPPTDPIRDLVTHTAWVRRLARRLVADPHLADDLAQTTCVAALERPPASGRTPRAWLATVLRNLLRQHRRREGDRAAREARAAAHAPLPSTTQTLSKVLAQREIAEAVAALDEPYRSVVLWRYFDDLPPREIARRRRVPVATVKSQLQRALGQLRGRLQAADAQRGTPWVTALAPLLAMPAHDQGLGSPVQAASIPGALMMKTNTAYVVAAIGILAVAAWGTWMWIEGAEPGSGSGPGNVRNTAGQSSEHGIEPANRMQIGGESPSRRTEIASGSPVDTGKQERTFQGRVFDASGTPLAGVIVRAVPAARGVQATSTADGRFELPVTDHAQEIQVDGEDWATLVAGQMAAGGPTGNLEPIVVAAPAMRLGGVVVDDAGQPVAGATLRFGLPANFATRFAVSLDATRSAYRDWRTETDARGRFLLPRVAAVAGASLRVRMRDYAPGRFDAPGKSRDDLRLTIRRPVRSGGAGVEVLGQVVDLRGEPVAGARVGMANRRTISGPDGRFRIAFGDKAPKGPLPLTALVRGHLPARLDVELPAPGSPPPFVFLYLGQKPLTIQGRVVDGNGRPVPGARVWARDAELAEGLGGSVEGYLAGGATRKELRKRLAAAPHLAEDADELGTIQPSAEWGWVRADRDGNFQLVGLQSRYYRLGVMHDKTLQFDKAGPFAAGATGVVIRFSPDVHAEVGGRVVGLDGQPIQGVTVQVTAWADLGETRRRRDGKKFRNLEAIPGPRCRTNAEGRFRLRDLGKQPFFLTVLGDHVMNRNFGLQEHGMENVKPARPVDDLRLVVARRFHLRLEVGTGIADRFRVVDAADKPLPIVLFDGGGRNSSGSRPIVEGRSRVYAVGEAAAAVVLLLDGKEVQRLPVSLKSGEVNVVRR